MDIFVAEFKYGTWNLGKATVVKETPKTYTVENQESLIGLGWIPHWVRKDKDEQGLGGLMNTKRDMQMDWAYSCWLFARWSENYGSYSDIEWAMDAGLLCPFRIPRWPWRPIIKWIIRCRRKYLKARLARLYECED